MTQDRENGKASKKTGSAVPYCDNQSIPAGKKIHEFHETKSKNSYFPKKVKKKAKPDDVIVKFIVRRH